MTARHYVVAGGAVAVAAAAAGHLAARRRWRAGPDTTDGVLVEAEGEERTIVSADGATLAVRIAGPAGGPAVVLSHCWTGDRRMWGPVARRLVSSGHRVITWDQRGHGRSKPGDDGYTIEAMAGDLAAIVEQLDVHDAVLAGHSMGGMVSQAALAQHPDVRRRTRGLALVATSCGDNSLTGSPRADAFGLKYMEAALLYRAMARPGIGPHLVRGVFGSTPSMAHLAATAECFAATLPAAVRGCAEAMSVMDLSPHLPGFDLPTVVVIGSRDTLTPLARSERIVSLIPGAELVVLQDAGHMLPTERPRELAEILEKLAVA